MEYAECVESEAPDYQKLDTQECMDDVGSAAADGSGLDPHPKPPKGARHGATPGRGAWPGWGLGSAGLGKGGGRRWRLRWRARRESQGKHQPLIAHLLLRRPPQRAGVCPGMGRHGGTPGTEERVRMRQGLHVVRALPELVSLTHLRAPDPLLGGGGGGFCKTGGPGKLEARKKIFRPSGLE